MNKLLRHFFLSLCFLCSMCGEIHHPGTCTNLGISLAHADTKISAMTSGAPAQGTDAAHFARAGADYKLTASDLRLYSLGNSFTQFNGPSGSAKTFTLPNSNATLLYDTGPVTNLTGTAASLTAGNATLAANLSGTPAIPNGTTATTQSAGDNTTKLATNAFVTTAVANGIAASNPAIAAQAATTAASNTSGCTYANGASGIGATLTCEVNTVKVIDGYTFNAIGQRLLVKNDTQSPSGAFNGLYTLTALHTGITGDIYTRALDFDQSSDINNTGAIPVVNGTVNGDTSWLVTSSVTTVGTDPITFAQFSVNPTTIITSGSAAGGVLGGTYPNPSTTTQFGLTIDGGGSTPTTGAKPGITITYAGTITNWYILADTSCSAVVDIKRSGTSIVGPGNKPTLSSASSANAAPSSWTSTTISAGDTFTYNLDSVSGCGWINVVFKVNRTS